MAKTYTVKQGDTIQDVAFNVSGSLESDPELGLRKTCRRLGKYQRGVLLAAQRYQLDAPVGYNYVVDLKVEFCVCHCVILVFS